MPSDQRQPVTDTLRVLAEGEIELLGRMPWSSNGTFLVTVTLGGDQMNAIYKPHRGERPLWDFPAGLYQREVAAYELSKVLGWPRIPETVLRTGAPFGVGSLQRFVDADFDQQYFSLVESEHYHPALQAMAAFDLVVNNADRKGGHCLLDADDNIWGIDHGLCFNVAPKLRTVIWDFCGQDIPAPLLDDLRTLAASPPASLATLLNGAERDAIGRRAERVAAAGVFPDPGDGWPFPWPLV